jgi:hypothetical protein
MFLKTKGTSPRDYLKPRTKVRKIIILTSLTPAPPVKQAPVHNPVFQIITFMQSYMYILYLALSLGIGMEP